jgi:hypothetical protein
MTNTSKAGRSGEEAAPVGLGDGGGTVAHAQLLVDVQQGVLTVASLTKSLAAAWRLVAPSAIRASTSSSRWLRTSGGGLRTWPISRLATAGERTASPANAARTARISSSRGASLSRYPVAPASIAGSTSLSVS